MPPEHTEFTPQDRREFLNRCMQAVAGMTLTSLALPLLQGCEFAETLGTPPPSGGTMVIDVSTLTSDGDSLKSPDPGPEGFSILVIRQSAETYVALSSKCTHEGCGVDRPYEGVIVCQCHGAEYDLEGNVTKEPATKSLTRYTVIFDAVAKTVTVQF